MSEITQIAGKLATRMSNARIDSMLFIAGIIFILIGCINGISTSDGFVLIVGKPFSAPLLVFGGVLLLTGVAANLTGQPAVHEATAVPESLKHFVDWEKEKPVGNIPSPFNDPERSASAAESRRQQREELKNRVQVHPLVARIVSGIPSSNDIDTYRTEMQDRYAVLTSTNKKIVHYVYRQAAGREVSIDELFSSFNSWHSGKNVASVSEFVQRLLLISAAGFTTAKCVGARRTIIIKIVAAEDALEGVLS